MSWNKKNLGKWIKACRDPKLRQTTGILRQEKYDDDTSKYFGYCCLGVACKISRKGRFLDEMAVFRDTKPAKKSDEDWIDRNSSYMTLGVQEWLGADSSDPVIELPPEYYWTALYGGDRNVFDEDTLKSLPAAISCSGLNDSWGLTLPQIADMLEYFIYNNLPDAEQE